MYVISLKKILHMIKIKYDSPPKVLTHVNTIRPYIIGLINKQGHF